MKNSYFIMRITAYSEKNFKYLTKVELSLIKEGYENGNITFSERYLIYDNVKKGFTYRYCFKVGENFLYFKVDNEDIYEIEKIIRKNLNIFVPFKVGISNDIFEGDVFIIDINESFISFVINNDIFIVPKESLDYKMILESYNLSII